MGGAGQKAALEGLWRGFFEGAAADGPRLALDIACGAAPLAQFARSVPGAQALRFVCADYAPSALSAARAALRGEVDVVACDTLRLPFRGGAFAAVVSQFGVEYAGEAGFAEAARMGAKRVGIIAHFRGGVIDAECAANADAVEIFLSSDVISRARIALSKSSSADAEPHAKADAKLAAAMARLDSRLGALASSTGRDLALRYGGDLRRLVDRRSAYALDDSLAWLDGVKQRLLAYRARMQSMTKAAQTRADMERACRLFAEAGYDDIVFAPLNFGTDTLAGAWRLEARASGSVAPRPVRE